jgi:recombination protein RecA
MSKALAELSASISKPRNSESSPTSTASPLTTKADKFKALKAVEAQLNKQFSTQHSLIRMGSRVGTPMPHMPTGIISLDEDVFGIGGVPKGRILEVFGIESGGKTTLTLEIIAEEQRTGNLCAFVDAEHALDPNYAKSLGVNVDELMVSQPDSGEQALETVIALVESKAVSIVVVDSVAALVPQAELDGDMGDSHMGLQARMMSQAMRKLRGICGINGVTVIFINQVREKIGVMYGNPEVTTGGRALKFYASVRLDVRRQSKTDGGEITSGGVILGHRMKVKAVKNKVGTPFRETIVDLIYGRGIDRFADLVRYAVDVGAITATGSWLSFKDEKLGQGKDNAISYLRDKPDLMKAIRAEVAKAVAAQKAADQEAA